MFELNDLEGLLQNYSVILSFVHSEVGCNIPVWSGRRSQTETPWRGPAMTMLFVFSRLSDFAAIDVEPALIFQCGCILASHLREVLQREVMVNWPGMTQIASYSHSHLV